MILNKHKLVQVTFDMNISSLAKRYLFFQALFLEWPPDYLILAIKQMLHDLWLLVQKNPFHFPSLSNYMRKANFVCFKYQKSLKLNTTQLNRFL